MLKFIVGNVACLLGSVLSILLFGPLPIWWALAIFLVPLTAANFFLIRSKTCVPERINKRDPLLLVIGIAISMWFAADRYSKQRWIGASAEGRAAYESGDYPTAERLLNKAQILANRGGKLAGACKIENYLSQCYLDQGKYANAEQTSSAAVSSCRSSREDHELATAYLNLGMAYQYAGDLRKADSALSGALDLTDGGSEQDELRRAAIFNGFGMLKQGEGDSMAAEHYLLQAIGILERYPEVKDPDIATCYSNLGRVLFAEGKLDDAEDQYKKSLEVATKSTLRTRLSCHLR
jgi:tetratricopeptide (TPR) repeat protein